MTDDIARYGRILVLAPHPDDEVLGAGGFIARAARAGCEVSVAVVTSGRPPRYDAAHVARVRAEAERAHAVLGVARTLWLGMPAAALGETPHADLNAAVCEALRETRAETVLAPFLGDIHRDHQAVFDAALVASRPHSDTHPARILAYETLSETNWNAPYLTPGFHPNVFVDIEQTLELKLDAMARFASQLKPPPHERSLETLRALSQLRGAAVHRRAAEAFVTIRDII